MQMDCWEDPVKETGSTFPTLFPESKLKELQKQLGDRFNGQYRNDPSAKGTNPFNKDWFQRWVPEELPPVRHTLMIIDPSGKAKVDSDYTGIVVIHMTAGKKGYIEYGKRHMITDKKLADWIIFNAPKFLPDRIAIEDNKYGVIFELLQLLIAQYIRNSRIAQDEVEYVKSIPYRLIEVGAHGRPKPVRIRNVTGMLENGSFLLPYKGAEDLEEEMIRYPSLRDDVVDALAYTMDILAFPSPTDTPKFAASHQTPEQREAEEWDRIREEAKAGEDREFLDDPGMF